MSGVTVDVTSLKQRIIELARRHAAYVGRSPQASPYYLDQYRFVTRPEVLREIARALAALLPPETDRLAGTELAATPIVTALALETGLPFIIVRITGPSGGIGTPVEGEFTRGDRVTLVEDLLVSGNSALEAVGRIVNAGGRVVACLAVADRGRGAVRRLRDAGVPCHVLFTATDADLAL